MWYRRGIKALCVVLLCAPLAACWDSLDIQERDIASAVVTDFDPEASQYLFYVEIANINASEDGSGQKKSTPFRSLVSTGTSLAAAKFDLDRQADNPIFLGATRVVFITTRFAQAGVEEYVNRIRGTLDYRKTVELVTTSADPMEIMNSNSENNPSVGFAVENDMHHLTDDGSAIEVTVGDLMIATAVKKCGFVLPHVIFQDGDVTRNGYTLFKNSRMMGYVNGEDSRGLVYLLNPHGTFNYEVEYNSAKIMVQAQRKKLKVTPEFDGEKVRFRLELNLQCNIMYRSEDFPLPADLMDRFHSKLNGMLAEDVRAIIEGAQNTYCCDYLQFYKYFRARYPDEFAAMDWSQKFSQADMDIVIATKLQPYGLNNMQTD